MNLNLDLDALTNERQEITDFLSQPNAYADPNFAAKNRRLQELDELISLGKKRAQLQSDIKEAESDSELAIMKPDLEAELEQTEAKLAEMLIPRDPNDDKPAIIEIRAGAGGACDVRHRGKSERDDGRMDGNLLDAPADDISMSAT